MVCSRFFQVLLLCHVLNGHPHPEAEQQVSDCVVAICRRHLPAGRVLSVIGGEDSSLLTKTLHDLTAWSVSHLGHAHSYILLLVRSGDLTRHLTRVRQQATWDARAQFVVVYTSAELNDPPRHVFEELWTHRAANVIVLIPLFNHTMFYIDLYAWFPFQNSSCGGAVQESNVFLVDQWRGGRFLQGNTLFPLKVPNDIYGCPIVVSTFPWPPFIVAITPGNDVEDVEYGGLEIEMMKTIAHACNFTIKYVAPVPEGSKWGGKKANGSWFGTMADIVYGRANVTIGSLINTNERAFDFDTSRYYATNAVVWVVPRARSIPRWLNIVKIFSPCLWMLVIACWLAVAVVFWRQHTFSGFQACLILSLAILLGLSVTPQRSKRLFFMIYAFYCLQINTAYQSSLISFLTEPAYYKQVTNEKELMESSMNLACGYGYNQFFSKTDPISHRLSVCLSHEDCLDLASRQEIAIVCDKAAASFIISSSYVTTNGHPLFVILSDNIIYYYVGMMFAKGNILVERFNQIIDRANEAGLMIKWRKDVVRLSNTTGGHSQQVDPGTGPKRLALVHLQGAFFFLIFGNMLAGLVLLIEIIRYRIYGRD